MLLNAMEQGIMFEAHGAEVCNKKGDPHDPDVQTELAAFLVAAGPHAYYMCGGWCNGANSPEWYPVFDMPLGDPLANATLTDGVYVREFSKGTNVTYDTKNETGKIWWAPHVPNS